MVFHDIEVDSWGTIPGMSTDTHTHIYLALQTQPEKRSLQSRARCGSAIRMIIFILHVDLKVRAEDFIRGGGEILNVVVSNATRHEEPRLRRDRVQRKGCALTLWVRKVFEKLTLLQAFSDRFFPICALLISWGGGGGRKTAAPLCPLMIICHGYSMIT